MSANNTNRILQETGVEDASTDALSLSQNGAIPLGSTGPITRSQTSEVHPGFTPTEEQQETSNTNVTPTARSKRKRTPRKQRRTATATTAATTSTQDISNVTSSPVVTIEQFTQLLTSLNTLTAQVNNIQQQLSSNPTNTTSTNNNDITPTSATTSSSINTDTTPSTITDNVTNDKIPYNEINAENYSKYNIDWSKFNVTTYNERRLHGKFFTETLKNISMPKIEYKNASQTNVFEFVAWYSRFQKKLESLSLHRFLFLENFNDKPRNPLEIADDNFLANDIIWKFFPDDYNDLSNTRSSSSLFTAIKEKYFPNHPAAEAEKILQELDVSYDSQINHLETQFTVINILLAQDSNRQPITELFFIDKVMTKAKARFTEGFTVYYDRWDRTRKQYNLDNILTLLRKHIRQTSIIAQQSVSSSLPPHRIPGLANINKAKKVNRFNKGNNKFYGNHRNYSQSYNRNRFSQYPSKPNYYNKNYSHNNNQNNTQYNKSFKARKGRFQNHNHPRQTFYPNQQPNTRKPFQHNQITLLPHEQPQQDTDTSSEIYDPTKPSNFGVNVIQLHNINNHNDTFNNKLMLDNGAQLHITNHPELLHNIIYETGTAAACNQQSIPLIGYGDYSLQLEDRTLELKTYITSPETPLSFPLILSEQILRDEHHLSVFNHYQKQCYLYDADTNKHLINLTKVNGFLTLSIPATHLVNIIHPTTPLSHTSTTHTICSHFNKRKIFKLLYHDAPGRTITLSQSQLNTLRQSLKKHTTCTACLESKPSKKNTKYPFITPVTTPLERISADLLYLGEQYFLVITDHFSSYLWVFQLTTKSQTFLILEEFINTIDRQIPTHKIRKFLTDNGSEFINKKVTTLLRNKGITHNIIPTHTPTINGKVERANRTLIEGTRAIMIQSNTPLKFIGYAVQHVAEWFNLLPQGKKSNSPRELLYGKSHISSELFHPFGCKVHYLLVASRGGTTKIDPISNEGIYLGFRFDKLIGHIILDPKHNKLHVTTHVTFHDNSPGFTTVIPLKEILQNLQIPDTPILKQDTYITSPKNSHKRKINSIEVDNSTPIQPRTAEAIKYPAWRRAIITEFENHHKYGTFKLVTRPHEIPLIPLSWVFTPKYNIDQSINKYKARLVAAGNFEPLDEEEVTAAPTTDPSTVKILLSLALQFGWSIQQADVTAAYLHAPLTKEVYARLPQHYEQYFAGADPDHECLLLQQSLYGLRVSGRNWFDHFTNTLQSIQFEPIYTCDTLFFKRTSRGIIFCLIYVDDCLLTGSSDNLLQQTIHDLQNTGIDIKLLGSLQHFLGVQHTRTGPHTMTLHRPPSTSLKNNESITKFPTPSYQYYLDKEQLLSAQPYAFPIRSHVGNMLFSALSTRPDLTFATIYLSKLIEHPNTATWKLCNRLEYYYKATANLKLHLHVHPKSNPQFHIYCDSDHASDPITRASFGGFIVYYGNVPIYWRTRCSQIICTSSTHSELQAAYTAVNETRWLYQIIQELRKLIGLPPLTTRHLYQDNMSTIKILEADFFNIKNWDVKYKHLHQLVANKEVTLHYKPTADMIADIFTKPLETKAFQKHRSSLQLYP